MLERDWWIDMAEHQLGDAAAWQRVSGQDGAPPAVFSQSARPLLTRWAR